MNRSEVTKKLHEIITEIEAVYKKHDCAGVFCAYLPGVSGTPEDNASDYQNEGQGGVSVMLAPSYSIVKKLSEISPEHPALKEPGGDGIFVIALTMEQVNSDKETLREIIGPTAVMARTVSILMTQATYACQSLSQNCDDIFREFGIPAPASYTVGNTDTGEGMDQLPPEIEPKSIH